MFDNLNQQNNPVQTGPKITNPIAPTGAEDIFAETEPVVEKPAQFQPIAPGDNNQYMSTEPGNGNLQKVFFLLIVLFGFSLLATGAYFGYKYFLASKITVKEDVVQKNDLVEPVKENPVPATPAVVATETPSTIPAVVSEQIVDSDKDGLSDTEELALGLSISNSDTDSDGLSDKQEVKTYKTDPKNLDTDGDGMSDGDEVAAKRNPNGSGSLLDMNSTSTTPSIPDMTGNNATTAPEIATTAKEAVVDYTLDTDKDGLTDYEETNRYKTNPLKADTDGDGYTDGAEIKGGYNPNGAGKL